jgi:hypothetical protein
MDMSPFVSSDPAVRADGWSPERKLRFLSRLAACGNVRAASAAVGMSRDAAYVLRRRDALFARGWAAALLLARESSVDVLADMATEGIEEEVWNRGEMVGTRRRFDARLLLAHIARLDKQVENAGIEAGMDAARFDAILAAIAGAEVPSELRDEHDEVALGRECAVEAAADEAREAAEAAWAERLAAAENADEDGAPDDECRAVHESELEAAVAHARGEAGARWDAWFREACAAVDTVLEGRPAPEPKRDAPVASATREAAPQPPVSSPRTVSEVSVSPRPGTHEWHLAQRAMREAGGEGGA